MIMVIMCIPQLFQCSGIGFTVINNVTRAPQDRGICKDPLAGIDGHVSGVIDLNILALCIQEDPLLRQENIKAPLVIHDRFARFQACMTEPLMVGRNYHRAGTITANKSQNHVSP